MKKADLPKIAQSERRGGISFELPRSAVARWDPLLRPAAAADDEVSIDVLDFIGPEDWGGIGAKTFARALAGAAGKPVIVNINSPGGDMFEGIAIYNLLRDYAGRITVKVLGLAASAASIVAMGADRIEIGRTAFMMIHNVWVLAIGNRHELRESADWIEPFDEALAGLYAARTGKGKRKMAELMDAETWFGGEAAIEDGFADALLAADAVGKKKDEDMDEDDHMYSLVRRLDAALLKGGARREDRVTLMNQLRGALEKRAPAPAQPRQEVTMTTPNTQQPPAAEPAAPASAAPAAAAPAAPAPAAPAAGDQRARIKGILALDEAKGREKQANHIALETEMTVEQAKGLLAASPKGSRLDDVMAGRSPRISSQEEEPTKLAPIDSPFKVYERLNNTYRDASRARR